MLTRRLQRLTNRNRFGWGALALLVTACGTGVNGSSDASTPDVRDAATDKAGSPSTASDTLGPPPFGLTERPKNSGCKPPLSSSKIAERLSQTGCVASTNPQQPAEGLIPYDVSSPLWSDGAEKRRFFALPDDAKLTVDEARDGHIEFPVGTVFVKTFGFGGRLHETRLLVKFREDVWKGYTYKWRDDLSDADLLPDNIEGETASIRDGEGNTVAWHYPSREQCLQCHNEAAGISLGPELRQLNIDFDYLSGVKSNQLKTWEHIGLFASALPKALPDPYRRADDGTARVEERARSYLHVNCANCHRPGSNFDEFDLRYSTTERQMNVCNIAPSKGDLGITGAKRVVPGEGGESVLLLRMKTLQKTRMPQIGTNVVDPAGVAAVEKWIEQKAGCP